MSRKDAIEALRFPCLLDNAIKCGWIKPVAYTGSSRAGSAIFAGKDVEMVVSRVLAGDIPPNPQVKK